MKNFCSAENPGKRAKRQAAAARERIFVSHISAKDLYLDYSMENSQNATLEKTIQAENGQKQTG